MDKKNISLEARKALNDFKIEIAEEITGKDTNLYDLRANLSDSISTPKLIQVGERSRNGPNNSFHDFLGKGF